MDKKDKFKPMATKVSSEMAEVWNAICDALGTDTYHMLQAFIYAMIRAASPQHALTPEMRKLMTFLETDVAWQNAINICAPGGKETIEQLIVIYSQEGKKGFGMSMLNRPFVGNVTQTECVDDIVERVCEVGVKGLYRRLRELGNLLGTESIVESLITVADEKISAERDRQDLEEMCGPANYHEYRGEIAYGKKTKAHQRRTIDMYDQQQSFHFDPERPYGEQADEYLRNLAERARQEEEEYDREMEERARQEEAQQLSDRMGFAPFGGEW